MADIENGNNADDASLSKQEQDIIRQIEYYFSESNMRRDKYLKQKTDEDPEKWIPISVLLTFKRLQALTEDPKVVAESMLKSSHGVIEVSDDHTKVRRHPDNPLPEFNEARRKELTQRTAYAKGFPLDSNMNILVEYFNSNFEKVENVIMRKYFNQNDKKYYFKGSVFVLFETKEAAEEFVERAELKYGEKDLLRYMQDEYYRVKRQEIKDKAEAKKAKAKLKEAEEMKIELPKKAILRFTTEGEPTIRREEFKKRLLEIDPSLLVAFIHYEMGDKEGNVRFSKENDATKFLEKLEGAKLEAGGTEFVMSLLEGDAEEEFLKKAVEDKLKVRVQNKVIK